MAWHTSSFAGRDLYAALHDRCRVSGHPALDLELDSPGHGATGEGLPKRRAQASGEIYLRLLDLDLEDLEAISCFVNEYGILGVYNIEHEWPWPHFQIPVDDTYGARLKAARRTAGFPIVQRATAFLAAHRMRAPKGDPWTDPERAGFEEEEVETLVEFRYGAKQIRDAVAAIRFLRGELAFDDLQWESPTAHWAATRITTGTTWLPGIEDFLVTFFDRGLEVFHPGIMFLDLGDMSLASTAEKRFSGARPAVVAPSDTGRYDARLYSICCLEIYNHLVEQAPYRLCQNETCHRLFVRQSGRAKYGQHRLRGTLYCSHTCAKAQAQRELRRRRRAKAAPS